MILKEAGGYLSFLDKDAKHSKTKSIVASNSNIHQELLEAITKKNIE